MNKWDAFYLWLFVIIPAIGIASVFLISIIWGLKDSIKILFNGLIDMISPRMRAKHQKEREDLEKKLAEQEHQRKLQEYKKGLKTITEVPDWMQDKEHKENNTPNWL